MRKLVILASDQKHAFARELNQLLLISQTLEITFTITRMNCHIQSVNGSPMHYSNNNTGSHLDFN